VLENSTADLLPAHAQVRLAGTAAWKRGQVPSLEEALQEPERQILLAALEANGWNRQQTADQLQINRTTLYKKIKQYGLEALDRAG
jgi:DNA-binding NtrC family response regulator